MGTISVVLATTIVNVAIPAIMADFGLDQVRAQWLATGFLAAMTATMLTSAPLMQRLGQRRTFTAALALFFVASVLAALSWNSAVMIAARILQGAVAGIIQPLAMVVIFQTFPDHERGRALGLYGMGVVLAPALGPTLGGLLVDTLSWRAVYLAPLPFCALGLLGAWRTLDNRRPAPSGPFDWLGMALLAPGLFALLAGLVGLSVHGGGAAQGSMLVLATLLLAAFLLRQWRARSPLVSLAVFRYPALALSVVLALIYGAGLYASTYLLPLLVQG
ncbi:MAG: MFS transporter, partial [Salinisphaera sp.]|nr:MFS transporter [Salinisphaera sp.]